jgi:tetratricopeptide (TPR) repeat protein
LDAAGEAYFRVGMIDRALPLFERALEADPLSATVRQEIARCYFHTGAYQKGIDSVKPLFGEGMGAEWIGTLLYSELGQFDEAIAQWTRPARLTPRIFRRREPI